MAASAPVLLRVLSAAYGAAERAGEIIRRIMSEGDLGIVEKNGALDLQTKADRLVQQSIVGYLARHFPALKVIGEEEVEAGGSPELLEGSLSDEILQQTCPEELSKAQENELIVWLDPLDGTKEYTEGLLDHVTVLIGLAYQGKAVAGVINQPFYNYKAGKGAQLGRTVWGVLGIGGFGFHPAAIPGGKCIVVTTRSHSNKLVNDCVDAMMPDKVVRVGGAGNKVLQLIEGQASAYVFASPGTKKWDTCAPEAILHAFGGQLTDMHGNKLEYHPTVKHQNSAGVLAALNDFDLFLNRVPPNVKAALHP
uniref:3'(2'),5'-bisphosphate nucleotidase 1 n=1 Tax=Eptatretus burgeri TaxID=7764 RepID=A0A8C4N5C0_EPTBU